MTTDDLAGRTATTDSVPWRFTPTDSIRLTGTGPVDISGYPGRLVVLEGTDGVGRSTQIALLREWLETAGYGVLHTGMTRSRLAGEGLRRAKQGTTASRQTLELLYATDFADRMENEVLPALRAGFVVLTDRYFYSIIARAVVRGLDSEWLSDLYRFAPVPHGVLYLKADLPHLLPRVLSCGSLDYWESGMDFLEGTDVFDCFSRYQVRLLSTFDESAATHGFTVIDACRDVADVFRDVRDHVVKLVSSMKGSNP